MYLGASAWDEFQWEAHLRRLDRIADRLMEVQFLHPPYPFETRPPGRWAASDTGAADDPEEYIEEEYGLTSTPGRLLSDAGDCMLKAFQLTSTPAARSRDASLVVEFLANMLALGTQLARAAGAEEEGEELGKGIALAKRSLDAANRALGAVAELRRRNICRHDEVLVFARELTELRNQIACYVYDLRERFRLFGRVS